MAIRNWHPLKIILLWIFLFFVMLYTLVQELDGQDLALSWLPLFILVFAVTWRWATGLQKASNSTQGEPSAPVRILDPPRRSSFYATGWRKIALILFVATAGATGGYWYKGFESHDFPDIWIEIRDNPDDLSGRVRFSPDHKASLKPHEVEIKVKNIETKVKFATARFNRTEDAELLYRGSLKTFTTFINPSVVYRDDPDPLSRCEFYLVFELYDKDNFFLTGLVGPRDTFGLMQEKAIEGIVEEVIPRQMARRTATIKRQVIFDKCT